LPLALASDLDHTMLGPGLQADGVPRLLNLLRVLDIPVAPVTAKTLEEVDLLAAELGYWWPLAAVENAAAVAAPPGSLPDPDYRIVAPTGRVYEVKELAPRLEDYAGAALEAARRACPGVRPLHEMDPREVAAITGLPLDHAKAATRRRHVLTLWAPERGCLEEAARALEDAGYNASMGSRFIHAYPHGGKREAVRYMRLLPWLEGRAIIGLGDSPVDSSLLEEADLAVVVPRGGRVRVRPGRDYLVAPCDAPCGWVTAVSLLVLNPPRLRASTGF